MMDKIPTKKVKSPFQVLREQIEDKYKKPISRKELADRMKLICPVIDEKKIERIENGRVKSIDIDIYKAYMQYFGVSADFLMGFSNTPKRFDNDVISCADYLGISRKAIETIHNMIDTSVLLSDSLTIRDINYFMQNHYFKDETDFWSQVIPDLDSYGSNEQYKIEREKIKSDFCDIAKKAGFAFDMVLSSPGDYSSSIFCIELFHCIYNMLKARARYLSNKDMSARTFQIYLYDLQDILQKYIKQLNIGAFNDLSTDFDIIHNTDIKSDLFGD